MFASYLLILLFIAKDCSSQEEDETYRGKLIGKINSYHHQVSGEVYAVDDFTLLLVNLNYDGTGDDAFFWAGDSGRPGPQGFIIPDEHGKTNVLERYYNSNIRLKLPDGKRVSRLKWFSIYELATQNAFGDVLFPEEFEPPSAVDLGPLLSTAPGVRSGKIQVLDANTVLIRELHFPGGGAARWWSGAGPQPSARGRRVPDEYGYLEPLPAYTGQDVTLTSPRRWGAGGAGGGGGGGGGGGAWLALWDAAAGRSLGHVVFPDELNVPPSYREVHTYKSSLPNCVQLHRRLQASWELFGNQLTVQLAAQMSEDEYVAFGPAGPGAYAGADGGAGAVGGEGEGADGGGEPGAAMLGADPAVVQFDPVQQRFTVTDYNISALATCVQVLGAWRGVCRDADVGGQDSNQLLSAARDNGLVVATYRRTLQPAESMDLPWRTEGPQRVVWALGALAAGRPGHHALRPARAVTINISRDAASDCEDFIIGLPSPAPWPRAALLEPARRVLHLTLAPARAAPAPLVWWVGGAPQPDIYLKRALTYTFQVSGGNDPHSATLYHPLVITSSASPPGPAPAPPGLAPPGPPAAPRALAGLSLTRRGQAAPTAAGPLCLGTSPVDLRRYNGSARAYNRTLHREPCAAPRDLTVSPAAWPDLVYYHSYTQPGMGGRIFIVDRLPRRAGLRSRARAPGPAVAALLAAAAAAALAPRA